MLEFGEKIEGMEYNELTCVRAIIQNDQEEFAFVSTKSGYFLIGGGIEEGESHEQALHREAEEEIGARIRIGRKIEEAADFVYGKKENAYFHKTNTFYEATIDGEIRGGTEPDHELVWRTLEQAEPHIKQKSQVWAIEQLLKQTDN